MSDDTGAAQDDGIKHVVVLMLENHSFDQMLGAMQEMFPEVEGVTVASGPARVNLTTDGRPIAQQPRTEQQMKFDPKHEHENVSRQLPGNNGGFVTEFQRAYGKQNCTDDDLRDVMGYYPCGFLPALHALAEQFTICDNWFSSLPGPTWPNRFFALTGSCNGEVLMPSGAQMLNPKWYTEQDQPTIFDRLGEKQRTWRIYYYDFPCSLVLANQRKAENLSHYSKIDNFFTEAAGRADDFPEFTLIEPQYFGVAQNDDHPPHNVMKAEKLIADVYNALRSNPSLWESTLLAVFYDEHGGFYDHVVPPAAKPPQPAAAGEAPPPYGFDRYGVRVPALLISPRCGRRVEKTLFDHTSVLKYLSDKWSLGPLGERTAAANSIGVAIAAGPVADRDTIPFIRVSNADLISPDVEMEKDATNMNQEALHHFAEFLLKWEDPALQGGVALAADAAKVGTWWTARMHDLGRALTIAGKWFSSDMRAAQRQRIDRTRGAVELLVNSKR